MQRPLYGIAEIAEALGLSRQLVTVWRKRRSHGMPEPDAELASGPIWHGDTVEPWIEQTRGKLGLGDGPVPASRELVLRTCRRVLRLTAVTLEEPERPRLFAQAVAEVEELFPLIDACAQDAVGVLLRDLVSPVREFAGNTGQLRAGLINVLPSVTAAVRKIAEEDERQLA